MESEALVRSRVSKQMGQTKGEEASDSRANPHARAFGNNPLGGPLGVGNNRLENDFETIRAIPHGAPALDAEISPPKAPRFPLYFAFESYSPSRLSILSVSLALSLSALYSCISLEDRGTKAHENDTKEPRLLSINTDRSSETRRNAIPQSCADHILFSLLSRCCSPLHGAPILPSPPSSVSGSRCIHGYSRRAKISRIS